MLIQCRGKQNQQKEKSENHKFMYKKKEKIIQMKLSGNFPPRKFTINVFKDMILASDYEANKPSF